MKLITDTNLLVKLQARLNDIKARMTCNLNELNSGEILIIARIRAYEPQNHGGLLACSNTGLVFDLDMSPNVHIKEVISLIIQYEEDFALKAGGRISPQISTRASPLCTRTVALQTLIVCK